MITCPIKTELLIAAGSAALATVLSPTVARAEVTPIAPLDSDLLAEFNSIVIEQIEMAPLTDQQLNMLALDPSALTLSQDIDDVQVYFINESADFQNQLLFSTDNGNTLTSIFDSVSSPNSIRPNSDGPLELGQGVSLGSFSSSTVLDFFLKSTDFVGTTFTFGLDSTQNPDGLQHIVAYETQDFLLLGFEDIFGGGDRDYTDAVIAVKLVQDVPEPASLLGLLSVGIVGAGSVVGRLGRTRE
ncbi:MAG: DUF4114 domain-containing protein [Symploca sp. SIO2E6]|nr:DUF4114 domain-containing protein [Symploca sp. SIO2E6]